MLSISEESVSKAPKDTIINKKDFETLELEADREGLRTLYLSKKLLDDQKLVD